LKIPVKKNRKSKKNPDPKLTPEQKEYNRFVGKTAWWSRIATLA